MRRFEKEVWAFAQKQEEGFRPKDVVQHLRKTVGGIFPSCGGNTTQVYLSIYALVKKGKLRKTVAEQKARRHGYRYEAVK